MAVSDPATASNVSEVVCADWSLTATVELTAKQLWGVLTMNLAPRKADALPSRIVLDVHQLRVAAVHCANSGAALAFKVEPFAAFGSALVIDTPASTGFWAAGKPAIRVYYVAGEGAAFCWLDPVQTAGKVHPFLFTQGQACLNRTFFPCQDSPGARSAWSATILIRKPYSVVMSAPMENAVEGTTAAGLAVSDELVASMYPPAGTPEADTLFPRINAAEYHAFKATMPKSVPAYLVAMAAGDLKAADIGPRSRVWSEPAYLERARYEFGNNNVTEAYVATAEKHFGPYQWGRYDIVVMPPAFPYGGMENPTATFCTPALLAGDQSLTDVIAHEIAHSWTGNLVTNSTWQQFFLNEGFTMYIQRRITTLVHGAAFTALETVTGRSLLRAMMRDYGVDNELTRLVVPLGDGIDPDETYTEAPYEKGFAFVSYLRACVGSDEAFDAWLHTYTSRFAFASISAVDMLECFFDSFPHLRGDWSRDAWIAEEAAEASSWWNTHAPVPEDLNTSSALPALPAEIVGASGKRGLAYRPGFEFMRWLHAPGWPAYYPDLSAAAQLSAPAEALAAAWLNNMAAGVPVAPPASAADFRTWPALQQLHFLDTLVAHVEKAAAAKEALAPYAALVHALDDVYNLSASGNAEIRLRWSQLIAGAVVEDKFSAVVDFLHMTGKLKYQTPVFRALVAAAPNAAGEKAATRLAVSTYATVRETLHPAVQSRIDGVFKGAGIALSA